MNLIPLLLWLWHGTNISHPSNPAIYPNHHFQFPTWNLAPPTSLCLHSTSRLWLFRQLTLSKFHSQSHLKTNQIWRHNMVRLKSCLTPNLHIWKIDIQFTCDLSNVKSTAPPRSRQPKRDRVSSSRKTSATLQFLNEASMDSNHHEATMAIDCKACSL